MGASQSASRLKSYINNVQPKARVFDGFQPQIIGVGDVRRNVVPILWVNSQSEVGDPVPRDSGLFRLWELAGPAHTSYNSDKYHEAMLAYSHSNGEAGEWDARDAGAWGYQSEPGTCMTANTIRRRTRGAPHSWRWTGGCARATRRRHSRAPSGTRRGNRRSTSTATSREASGPRCLRRRSPPTTRASLPRRPPIPAASWAARTALKGFTHVFEAAKLADSVSLAIRLPAVVR